MIKGKTINVRISREDHLYLASLGKKSTSEALRFLIASGRKNELKESTEDGSVQELIAQVEGLKRQLAEFQMSIESSQQVAISETIKRFFRTVSPNAKMAIKRDGASSID